MESRAVGTRVWGGEVDTMIQFNRKNKFWFSTANKMTTVNNAFFKIARRGVFYVLITKNV